MIARYVVPVMVLLSIWTPIVQHYRVPRVSITDEMIEAARHDPDDRVLAELKDAMLLPSVPVDRLQLVATADRLMQGELVLPGEPMRRITMPFSTADLETGSSGWQLHFAGFAVPRILVSAYEATGRQDFLNAAADVVVAWSEQEPRLWIPRGFVWNDHATASRVFVLADFWRVYRMQPVVRRKVAEAVLMAAARSADLLARNDQFNAATNHGVMGNLALWQTCIAFPSLPRAAEYKDIALARMHAQMPFYIDDEGVVLEHSAGYQRLGVQLVSIAFRQMTSLKLAIPESWREKRAKAEKVLALFQRTDGSLPVVGDTTTESSTSDPHAAPIDHGLVRALFPVAGSAIWWDGRGPSASQTVAVWSYFPGHAHKHADELSVLFWAGGQTWLTNVGYWSYDSPGRDAAESWSGSSAPHMVDEPADSARRSVLLGTASTPAVDVLDLERRTPGPYRVRRQLVHVKPALWIVVDSTEGTPPARTRVIWSTAHNVTMQSAATPGSYLLASPDVESTMRLLIRASADTQISEQRGSWSPFAGWEVGDPESGSRPLPASALVVDQPASHAWLASTWWWNGGKDAPPWARQPPAMTEWRGPTDWTLVFDAQPGLTIGRSGDRVTVTPGDATPGATARLVDAPEVDIETTRIRDAFNSAVAAHGARLRDLLEARLRATWLVVIVLGAQELALAIWGAMRSRRLPAVAVVTGSLWLVIGLWLRTVYLVA